MKIAFIIPENGIKGEKSFYDYKFFSRFLFSKKYFSYLLAVPTLVSLTPSEHEVRIFDENIEDIDYDWGADLVAISVRTMFATRAYAITKKFKERGVKTILGGIHPSMRTDEALIHCDSVVVGEAEGVWLQVLEDAKNNKLKKTYKANTPTDLKACSPPARSAMRKDKYFSDIVQTTKGCPFHCEFCSVYSFDGQKIRNKTVGQVIEEIAEISGTTVKYKKKSIFFADDNIIANKPFAKELFIALKPYNLNWSCQASINIAQEEELLTLMKASGCGAILVGLESVSEENLSQMDKGINLKHDYLESIKKIQSHGIMVHGSFILGYDFDTEKSFDELIDFIEKSKLLMPLINILTPFPGTKLFDRFEKDKRILHNEWDKFDGKTTVFTPLKMTADELTAGHRRVIRALYSFDAIEKKLNHYWDIDFWKKSNEVDPISFKYRMLFSLRLTSLLFSTNFKRSKFILKLLPKILFDKRVRISTILTLMAYNDYAYS
ncbi:MAG: B12-binding domain-containing radical SAM protein [Deltaproteobacteria bacterium]|nr:B12-binding domain-containing radical SAM protein [Deltaproteobacteria bacterium]